jgi:leader peptidase (prepilin peptidase)/N-methyltransferase
MCKVPISSQYPLVEVSSGALFLVALSRSPSDQIAALMIAVLLAFLLFSAVFDARYQRIPDVFTATIGVLGLMLAYRHDILFSALLGALVSFVWFGGQWAVSRGRWVGEGDIFLAVALGCWLGLADTLAMILLAYIVGTIVVGVLLLFRKTFVQGRIAFVPFLAAGALLAFLGMGQWYLGMIGV